jgi:hypothetical protein
MSERSSPLEEEVNETLREINSRFAEFYPDFEELGPRTADRLMIAYANGEVEDFEAHPFMLARWWNRAEQDYGDQAEFDLIPDPVNNVFHPREFETPFDELESEGRLFENFDEVIDRTARHLEAIRFRDMLQNHSVGFELNHAIDDAPGIGLGLILLAYRDLYGEDLGDDMNLLVGPRPLHAHANGRKPNAESINRVTNFVMIAPQNESGRIPGAERELKRMFLNGMRVWKKIEQTPGQIMAVARTGTSDLADGSMGQEPSPFAIAGAAPTERKITIPMSLYFPDDLSRIGLALGSPYYQDDRPAEEVGREILYEKVYGSLLEEAKQRAATQDLR